MGVDAPPMTSSLVTLRTDILAALRAHFPVETVPTVDRHDGEFSEKEIAHYARAAPALILVSNGGESSPRGGSVNEVHLLDLFIMTKGRTNRQRADGALIIYEHLLKLLHNTGWNTQECVANPTDVKSKNMYGRELDEMGMALWIVRWKQLVQLPFLSPEESANLDDFATLYATYTTARPTEDPADTAASEQAIELEQDP